MDKFRVAIALLVLLSSPAMAQSGDRAKTWDVGVQLSGTGSLNLSGQMGSGLDVDSDIGFGFWGLYNFTDRFGLGFDFNWSRPDYTARFIPENSLIPVDVSHTMDIFTVQAKGVFHFMEGPITPYVEVGVGWTGVDSNVADGPPVTGCWWDPWWGYRCDNFYDTYSENLTSYSGALGLRWDFNSYSGIRAAYGVLELDTSSNTENASFDMWRLEYAWRF